MGSTVSLFIEILQCHFFVKYFTTGFSDFCKNILVCNYFCLLSEVCKVHGIVSTVARLRKSEQFWFFPSREYSFTVKGQDWL